ncbi:MAG: single-stranded DNA-binding protein [Cyclobacteriaceae bacterium]|nr:single-stranded DNA-binding protein [Cyclobacteriaceae bacterium]
MKNIKNRIQLIGRLGGDPEFRLLESGKHVVNFSLATNETYKNAAGEKTVDTQWHYIVAWGPLADIADKYLQKGSEVVVQGKLIHKNYEGPDGVKKYFSEIVADDLLMIGKPQGEPISN